MHLKEFKFSSLTQQDRKVISIENNFGSSWTLVHGETGTGKSMILKLILACLIGDSTWNRLIDPYFRVFNNNEIILSAGLSVGNDLQTEKFKISNNLRVSHELDITDPYSVNYLRKSKLTKVESTRNSLPTISLSNNFSAYQSRYFLYASNSDNIYCGSIDNPNLFFDYCIHRLLSPVRIIKSTKTIASLFGATGIIRNNDNTELLDHLTRLYKLVIPDLISLDTHSADSPIITEKAKFCEHSLNRSRYKLLSFVRDLLICSSIKMYRRKCNRQDLEGLVLVDDINQIYPDHEKELRLILTSILPNVKFIVTSTNTSSAVKLRTNSIDDTIFYTGVKR